MTAVCLRMHKPRLNRLTRIHLKHPLYFLTLCTFQRKEILSEPTAHQAFVLFCEKAVVHGAFVGRYVLMPDHLHLFVSFTPAGVALSDWVKSLKNTLSKSWRSAGADAPHWQKGFFDHLMRSADSYEENGTTSQPILSGPD